MRLLDRNPRTSINVHLSPTQFATGGNGQWSDPAHGANMKAFGYQHRPVATRARALAADRLYGTPDEMLAEIICHSRFTAAEFDSLGTVSPVDVPGLHRRIRGMIESAWPFIDHLPSEAVGVVFIDGDRCVQPVVALLETFTRNPGAPGGVWQSPPAISKAM